MSTVYDFVDPPEVTLPSNCKLWTSMSYCDMTAWLSLPDNQSLEPRATRFEDGRFLFLDPVQEVPPEVAKLASGEYDIKTWMKNNCSISIEAEKSIYVKSPLYDEIVTYHHSSRFPAIQKSWKPILFLLNSSTVMCRITADFALMIAKIPTNDNSDSSVIHVSPVDYNKGFACSHPTENLAVVYGNFSVKNLRNYIAIPPISNTKGMWAFFVQFYKWGGLVVPKQLDVTKESVFSKLTKKNNNKIATIFHPPHIFLQIYLKCPQKINRSITYGKDFAITAKKESETDINVYLVMDGHLVVYNYSFDIRINKKEASDVTTVVKIPVTLDKENIESTSFIFKPDKDITVPISQGSPVGDISHLMSEQVLCFADTEIARYFTNPIGIKECNEVLKKLALPSKST